MGGHFTTGGHNPLQEPVCETCPYRNPDVLNAGWGWCKVRDSTSVSPTGGCDWHPEFHTLFRTRLGQMTTLYENEGLIANRLVRELETVAARLAECEQEREICNGAYAALAEEGRELESNLLAENRLLLRQLCAAGVDYLLAPLTDAEVERVKRLEDALNDIIDTDVDDSAVHCRIIARAALEGKVEG